MLHLSGNGPSATADGGFGNDPWGAAALSSPRSGRSGPARAPGVDTGPARGPYNGPAAQRPSGPAAQRPSGQRP